MDRHPTLRYVGAAGFIGIVATYVGTYLAGHSPETTGSWLLFVAGAALSNTLVAVGILRTPFKARQIRSDLYGGAAMTLLGCYGIGLVPWNAGSPAHGSMGALAAGSALGAVAVFGVGSWRAAREVRRRRLRGNADSAQMG